jgi:Co/Zn/Cd efflux system component
MEGSPSEIDTEGLVRDIRAIQEGTEIHDFHLWSISVGKFALSAHINCSGSPNMVLKEVTNLCKKKYGIDHLTIQIEDGSHENEHQFNCD